jgi:hypothetical protein
MLGPEVDEHVIGQQLRLHRRRRSKSQSGAIAAIVARHEGNALRTTLSVEPGGRKLDLDRPPA